MTDLLLRTSLFLSIGILFPAALLAQDPCTGSIDLGADVTLCEGNTVLLTPGPGYFSYLWDNGAATATRMVGGAGTYWCRVQELSPGSDLVVNGDFSAGSTGFTSGYVPGTGGAFGLLSLSGQYAVTTNASDVHDNFMPCTDHTGGGNMLVVNGSSTAGVSVWCQTIEVTPGTAYAFSAWLSTMIVENMAVLQFTINGELIGSPFQAAAVACQWNQFYQIWDSGANTSAEICITNQNTQGSGNDFALDDISFTQFCTYTDTVEVFVNQYPDPQLGPDQVICGTDPIVLDATTPDADIYTWNDGLAEGPTLEVSTSGTYWVNVYTGECLGRDSVEVTFHPQPVVELGPDLVMCPGDSMVLNAGVEDASYLWHDGSTDPTWTTWTTSEAWVEVSQGPCTDSDTVHISVETCEVVVVIPNVFTPNGDGVNGTFQPILLEGVQSLELEILNRWGQVVHTSKRMEFAWDGRADGGDLVPDGTYYWVLRYQGVTGPGEQCGVVTLLR